MIMTEAKLHFDIYDFEGVGKVDAFNLGDLVRSLDLKPTNAAVEKAGGTKKKGETNHALTDNCSFLSGTNKCTDRVQ
jgi:hypothetical protein